MASENNPVSSRPDYFASFIFSCCQCTKTDFEEENPPCWIDFALFTEEK